MYTAIGFASFVIIAFLLFKPTRERFIAIFNLNDISILKDSPLNSATDARINGLTLRLILWQEVFHLMNKEDFILGKGTGKDADKLLEEKLVKRGLEPAHTHYDPHNQFITTYYKMGLLGLILLILICAYNFYKALADKNKLLLYSCLLFVTAMLAESVLQRVVGIYFFVTILLLQSNSIFETKFNFEDSNTRH
jgi:O-antigen ligase